MVKTSFDGKFASVVTGSTKQKDAICAREQVDAEKIHFSR
jgi:hypothetical protein